MGRRRQDTWSYPGKAPGRGDLQGPLPSIDRPWVAEAGTRRRRRLRVHGRAVADTSLRYQAARARVHRSFAGRKPRILLFVSPEAERIRHPDSRASGNTIGDKQRLPDDRPQPEGQILSPYLYRQFAAA